MKKEDSKFTSTLERLEDGKIELTNLEMNRNPLDATINCKDIVWTKENVDAVNHPSHYTQDSEIECIDAIKASMTPNEFAGYCKGNCLKYIWRYEDKNGVEDLEKAQVYLTWLINILKGENLTK